MPRSSGPLAGRLGESCESRRTHASVSQRRAATHSLCTARVQRRHRGAKRSGSIRCFSSWRLTGYVRPIANHPCCNLQSRRRRHKARSQGARRLCLGRILIGSNDEIDTVEVGSSSRSLLSCWLPRSTRMTHLTEQSSGPTQLLRRRLHDRKHGYGTSENCRPGDCVQFLPCASSNEIKGGAPQMHTKADGLFVALHH